MIFIITQNTLLGQLLLENDNASALSWSQCGQLSTERP